MPADGLGDLEEGRAADDAAVVNLLGHRLPVLLNVVLKMHEDFLWSALLNPCAVRLLCLKLHN